MCYKPLSSCHWEHSTGTAPVGNEFQLSRPNTSPPNSKMHLRWHRESIPPPCAAQQRWQSGKGTGGTSTAEDATAEGSKQQTQQPDKAILHLNILVLPLQVDFGSRKTPAGLQVHISKLPKQQLMSKSPFWGKALGKVLLLEI